MSRSILLVDDDRGFSSLAQAALAREGHPVVLARSLHEAREAVERSAPELVVLDRRLPDGDGLDYLPELKAQLENLGYDPVGSSAAEFTSHIRTESEKYARVVKLSGAKID